MNYICEACGVQFAATESPPATCPICEDQRQYAEGRTQRWTTLAHLGRGHRNVIQPVGPGLMSVTTEPAFAIGQQAILVQGADGNVLWDCIALIDDPTIDALRSIGGVSAIAVSHPHFYGAMVEWSRAFGGVPIYVHAADREWMMRPDPAVVFWDGDRWSLTADMTLVRCAGHFEGGTVLHWMDRARGEGRLLTGDVIMVLRGAPRVTFMYSYPNRFPLPAAAIHRIVQAIEPLAFDQVYGCWPPLVIRSNAKSTVLRSAREYLREE